MTTPADKLLRDAIALLPAPLQPPVSLWLDRMHERHPRFADGLGSRPSVLGHLVRLVARSEFAGNVLLRQWDLCQEMLVDGERSIDAPAVDADDVRARLRRFRDLQLLHVLWREVAFEAPLEETLTSLSDLADGLIHIAADCAAVQMSRRFGRIVDDDGNVVELIVLAMGKLGGRELNFSSDVDLIFLYPKDGLSDGGRALAAHEYFTRISRQVVSLLDEVSPDGFVFRVDTRLRPFGDSGPPVASYAGLESYLLQHGRGWERYAYVKARVVVPAADVDAARELMDELIRPFVYRRYLDYGVFESLRDMKALIASEVRKRELAPNIKLGPGGIREIEFIVQSLQLVRGGANTRLRGSGLLSMLSELVDARNLTPGAAAALSTAYQFLRRLENALQAIRDQQTHEVPASEIDRVRVAFALGYRDWAALEADLERHRRQVSSQFADIAFRAEDRGQHADLADSASALWESGASEDEWRSFCERHGFGDAATLAAEVAEHAARPEWRRIDRTAQKRLRHFVQRLMPSLKRSRQPAVVFVRIMTIIRNIVRRSAYVALLNENPAVLERLLDLCAKSAYLAEQIGRFPLLLDEMLDPRLFTTALSADDMRADFEQRVSRFAGTDSERRIEVLGQFQRANLFRIAVADIGGSLPIMKVSDRLTDLAEIVLDRALRIAWGDLREKHGIPRYKADGTVRTAGFGIVAYGKLGGMELSYGSDLDLVFLHDSRGEEQQTDGAKPLENGLFFVRLVRRLVHFLAAQTGSGALYEVDTRLRPSGRSGLLVTSLEAFERYQEENAWTWEHQALLRSRPVAGDAIVAREFERVRAGTLRNRVRRDDLADDVLAMRNRMRKELDLSDADRFDLKQGEGGIGDIEFLVQFLVLKNADAHPAVIHYTDNIRQLGALAAAGCLDEDLALQLQDIYKQYRLRLHRLALDDEPPLVSAAEFHDQRRRVTEIRGREMRDGNGRPD